jgi:hypothetical protein
MDLKTLVAFFTIKKEVSELVKDVTGHDLAHALMPRLVPQAGSI